ncbi:hypothetical protein FQZ97_966110 [compost metagenome]
MDADATPQRDIADDRVARQRLAATGHLRQQVADTLDLDIATLARLETQCLARDKLELLAATFRLDQLLRQVDQMGQTQVAGP